MIDENIRVYNALAPSYRASRDTYRTAVHYALGPLAVHLLEKQRRTGEIPTVLDMGSGAGLHTESMIRHGFRVVAVDAAPDMLRIVRDNTPAAHCIEGEFWTFTPPAAYATGFDCVIAASFIHLFPKYQLQAVMDRLRSWLKPDGVIFIATVCGPSNEGNWIPKETNHGSAARWRVVYEQDELLTALTGMDFDLLYAWNDFDALHRGKVWSDLMLQPHRKPEGA